MNPPITTPEGIMPMARKMGELCSQFLRHQVDATNARAEFNAAWEAAMRERQERIWNAEAAGPPRINSRQGD
ncbi:MAG: hypothetical protein V4527_18270 [Pseudomonadota bacterium]